MSFWSSPVSNNIRGLLTLAKREIMRFIAVAQQTIFPPVVTSALFLFIFGLSVGSKIKDIGVGYSYLEFIIPGVMTLHLISGSFENTSSSLFISRWHNHIQEILLSPLSYFEMVLGLLAGGVVRGLMVFVGVFIVSMFFQPIGIAHPVWLAFFTVATSVIFSCFGMIAALWANNFSMLSIWNIYIITPMTFLGGVFNPIQMLPGPLQKAALFNPMHHLVSGIRYSLLGYEESSLFISSLTAAILAVAAFSFTVFLFKSGYKLRS